jgi:capsular polysaccharide biosynthesis protein
VVERLAVRVGLKRKPPIALGATADVALSAQGGNVTRLPALPFEEFPFETVHLPSVREFLREQVWQAHPERFHATIPGGLVHGSGALLSVDGQVICRDVSIAFGVDDSDHPLLHAVGLGPAQRLSGEAAILVTPKADNYYHWIFDCLPRLANLPEHFSGRLILPKIRFEFQRSTLAILGINLSRIVSIDERKVVRPDVCIVPSLASFTGHPSALAVRWLRENFVSRNAPKNKAHRLIYISRRDARARRLINEEEIANVLKAFRFEEVVLSDMSFDESVQLLGGARCVVAVHGAGMSNLVLCPPGARVIELANNDYLHWCYWELSHQCGHSHEFVLTNPEAPVRHHEPSCEASFHIDRHQLEAALTRMMSGIEGMN